MSAKQQRGLGKGLQALIGPAEPQEETQAHPGAGVLEAPVGSIDTNPAQARKRFDKEALKELAESIAVHGVIQPLIVKRTGARYRIIAGERRWRAARMAGLEKVPVIVTDYQDREEVEVSLIENLQREDLNPLEEAAGIRFLMDEYSLTQEQASARLGKSRSAVANALRLLSLPPDIQEHVWSGALSAGHARALAGIEDMELQAWMANTAIERGLSVREMEALKQRRAPGQKRIARTRLAPELDEMQERLQTAVGTRVKIAGTVDRGKITIEYYSREDIERIYAFLEGE
jgi:ParB family chromosome partitioning protein